MYRWLVTWNCSTRILSANLIGYFGVFCYKNSKPTFGKKKMNHMVRTKWKGWVNETRNPSAKLYLVELTPIYNQWAENMLKAISWSQCQCIVREYVEVLSVLLVRHRRIHYYIEQCSFDRLLDYSNRKEGSLQLGFSLNVTFITKLYGKNQSQTLLKQKQPMKCQFCCKSNQLFELPANNWFN